MKIINDLADGAVKNNKKDSFAIKISIFLAVILLGTVIFIFNAMRTEQYNYVRKNVGDYHGKGMTQDELDRKSVV